MVDVLRDRSPAPLKPWAFHLAAWCWQKLRLDAEQYGISHTVYSPPAFYQLSELQQAKTRRQHSQNIQELPKDERRRVELEQGSLLIFKSITKHSILTQDPASSRATRGEIRPFLHSMDPVARDDLQPRSSRANSVESLFIRRRRTSCSWYACQSVLWTTQQASSHTMCL
jgi:hypothetical protein